jgi:hypothetical protein
MRWVAAVLSLFVAVLGAVGVLWPASLLGIGEYVQTPLGLYAAAALRIMLGGALPSLLLHPACHGPFASSGS